jgi:hypothetical protein
LPPRRAGTQGRSIRWRPAFSRCASARRRNSRTPLLDARKEYLATVAFGVATDTGDAEGETLRKCDAPISREALAAALPRFVGTIMQTPPRYAALKHRGRNYYEYAREGIEIPRAPREVSIEAIELLGWEPPHAELRVACGKGTYIRALAGGHRGGLGELRASGGAATNRSRSFRAGGRVGARCARGDAAAGARRPAAACRCAARRDRAARRRCW